MSDQGKKSKSIKVTRAGLTRCPSCLSHVSVEVASVAQAQCPFCEAHLVSEIQRGEVEGGGVMRALRASRSALLAGALGASLLAGCGDPEPDPEPEPVNNVPQPLYGAPAPIEDMGQAASDMNNVDMDVLDEGRSTPAPQPLYGAVGPDDMGVDEVDEGVPVAEYGVPPMDDMG